MGTWGYRLDQNDCFCEVIDAFQDMLCKGEPVPQIPTKLLMEFGGSYDDHIVRLAIAEGLWRVNSLHDDALASILQLINSNVDNDYWSALGADSSFLSNRAAELNSFYKKISKPARQSQLWRIDSSQDSLSKGTCFWYREKGQIFGAVLLEIQKDYHLIALTEKLDSIPKTSEVILAYSQIIINLHRNKHIHTSLETEAITSCAVILSLCKVLYALKRRDIYKYVDRKRQLVKVVAVMKIKCYNSNNIPAFASNRTRVGLSLAVFQHNFVEGIHYHIRNHR